MRKTRVTESLPVDLLAPELLQLGKLLADERYKLAETEKQKADAMKAFKDRIEGHEVETVRLARLVHNGYEYRDVECAIEYNSPNIHEKTFARMDTGEVVRIVAMTPDECQEDLPLKEITYDKGITQ